MMRYEQDRNVFIALNGFDPAELMVVGERIPKREGFGRTGTLPFMAVELLEYRNGQISRWFRHDLESCMWCLVWQALAEEREHWYGENLARTISEKDAFDTQMSMHILKKE